MGAVDGASGPGLLDPLARGSRPGTSGARVGSTATRHALDAVLRDPCRGRGDELLADAVWAGGGVAGARVRRRVPGADAGPVCRLAARADLVGLSRDPGAGVLDGRGLLGANRQGSNAAGDVVVLVPRPLGGGLGPAG